MREKLLALMKSEGLKPSQLAELLDINPAGVSHILAGRNKPGFDLLQKILRRFPRISPDWLMLDAERMYRDQSASDTPTQTRTTGPGNATTHPFDVGLFGEPELREHMGHRREAGVSGTHGASDPHDGMPTTGTLRGRNAGGVPDGTSSGGKGGSETYNIGASQGRDGVTGAAMLRAVPTAKRVVIFYEDETFEYFTPR